MFDISWVFTFDQNCQVIDGTSDCARLELQRGLTQSIEAWYIGFNAHENPVAQLRIHDKGFDCSNFHNSAPGDRLTTNLPFNHGLKNNRNHDHEAKAQLGIEGVDPGRNNARINGTNDVGRYKSTDQ